MKNASKILIITLILVLSGSISAWADTVEGLKEFQAREPALASEVNANFTAVKAAVDENDTAITSNSSSIVTNAGNIEENNENLTKRNGVQNTSLTVYAEVTSTTNIEICSVYVSGTDSYDVTLTGHLHISVNGSNPGQYIFTITRDSTAGEIVGLHTGDRAPAQDIKVTRSASPDLMEALKDL